MKIITPVSNVKTILYRERNLIRSSMNPMIPADITVNRKINISFKKKGKKIIIRMLAIEIPRIMLIPPDSGISGLEFLWISIPTYPFFF